MPASSLVMTVLRQALLWVAVALAAVCVVDWLVRTRRLNPFSPVSRFFRRTVDPLMAPLERRLVRNGGNPANAPWWALAVVVVGGIILVEVLEFLVRFLGDAGAAASQGPRGIVFVLVRLAFSVMRLALLVRVILSWIPAVSPYNRWVRWAFVLTEPVLRPLRRVIPTLGPIDITPLLLWLLLGLLERPVLGLVLG